MSALYHLVPMIVRHVPSERKSILDNLDPFRRFDAAYPEIGAELEELLGQPVPQAAVGLLDLAAREFGPRVKAFPEGAFAVVRRAIAGG